MRLLTTPRVAIASDWGRAEEQVGERSVRCAEQCRHRTASGANRGARREQSKQSRAGRAETGGIEGAKKQQQHTGGRISLLCAWAGAMAHLL